jgi:Flp pilus assembly protein TadG
MRSRIQMGLLSLWCRRRKRAGQSGQSLDETALILPIFLFLLVGMVDVGDALNSYLTVVDVARDGARLGSKGKATDAEIKDLVLTEMGRLPDPIDSAEDITVSRNTMPGDESVKVRVCYDHSLILGLPGFIPDPIRLCSTTTMRAITYED